MAETAAQVTIRRLVTTSPTMIASVAVAAVGAVVVVVGGLVTRTGVDRIVSVIVGPLLLVCVAMILVRRTWVDTDAGTISRSIFGWPTRTVPWAEAAVDLQRNHGGQLNLRVKGSSGTILATVLAIDLGGDRVMQPDQLRLLAEEMERWAPAKARLAQAFRAQADHIESGGSIADSPFASRL